ncbi:MAG: iron-sulfur cluster assembly accessory protein [Candidatus Shikimatogenerans bostrichidophilus]|nr:MAG: iron-sulfur cluster assembly accessory protein [Candidatus Shikimatogenerans bostrichidophilus]
MLYISKQAKQKILYLIKKDNLSLENIFLRINLKNGGCCSGFYYKLKFDNKKKKDDKLFIIKKIKILIKKTFLIYLNGLKLHYKEELNKNGFIFINPNSKETCGCGNSFSYY